MATKATVLITPRSLTGTRHAVLTPLEAAGFELRHATPGKLPDEAELLRLIPGCIGWLAGVEPVSEAVIQAATVLRVISRNGVGSDNLPVNLLRERGVVVRTADGANARGVAELTVGLMLSALRHIPRVDAGIKAGAWPRLRGRELGGRTVGIVGCGAIGGRVATIVAAFGANVVTYDPFPRDLERDSPAWRRVQFTELLAYADVVTLHCPPPADGRALIDVEQLATMRHGAVLVNAARASLVDERAVCDALDAGSLDMYATDVFAEEPPQSLTLAGHPKVIGTSHLGAFTEESVERAGVIAVANLLDEINAGRSSRVGSP